MPQPTEETLRYISEHRDDDVRSLALRPGRHEGVDLPYALTQIEGRQRIRLKVPSWADAEGLAYPPHLPIEQCSSQATALYKSKVISATGAHGSLTDLTGGFGVDCFFISRLFGHATYVERQQMLADTVRHNYQVLGARNIDVLNADATDHLRSMQPVDWLFLDPARRDSHGGKTVAISDCEPDILSLMPLLLEKARHIMVKLSPMLDLTQALQQTGNVQEAHVVSVANECKELLLVIGHTSADTEHVPIHCVNIAHGSTQTFTSTKADERAGCRYADAVGGYLYEPNASILKAGAVCAVARRFGLLKLHPNSHLYTSDSLVADFPGRIFTVEGSSGMNKRELKQLLGSAGSANLTIRNFPSSVGELRKRLRLNEGGDVYLFATTLNDGRRVIIKCHKP